MALQIANPAVIEKIERLARQIGLSETAAIEKAVDVLLDERAERMADARRRMDAILEEFDRLPRRPDASDPLEWDENGLPR